MFYERHIHIHLICSCVAYYFLATIGGSQIEGWRKLHFTWGPRVMPTACCLQVPLARAKARVPGWASCSPGQGQGEPGGLTLLQPMASVGCRAPRRWSRPRSSPHNSQQVLLVLRLDPTARPLRSWYSGDVETRPGAEGTTAETGAQAQRHQGQGPHQRPAAPPSTRLGLCEAWTTRTE